MTFLLDPLYKLTGTVVGEHPKTIERVLGEQFGIYLKSSSYSQDVKPLLKEVSCDCTLSPLVTGLVRLSAAQVVLQPHSTPSLL